MVGAGDVQVRLGFLISALQPLPRVAARLALCHHQVSLSLGLLSPLAMRRLRSQPGTRGNIIPSQVIAQARGGDVKALWSLHGELTSANCPEDVVSIVLSHLRLELVPNLAEDEHKVEPYQTYAGRALPCITMLSTIAKAISSRPSLRDAVTQRVQDELDGICMWVNHMLTFGLSIDMETAPGKDFRKPYFFHAQLLCDLLDCDPGIRTALLSGTRFFDLLIRIWMTEGKDGELFMNITSSTPCPIIAVMLKTLKSDGGRDMLLQRILVCPPAFRHHFVDRLIMRAIQIIEVEVPTQRQWNYIDALLTIAEILLSDREPVDLRPCFTRKSYLHEFSTVLNAISMEAGLRTDGHTVVPGMLIPTHRLFSLIMRESFRVARNYRDLLAGDILKHLVRVLAWLPNGDRAAADVGNLLVRMLGMYTIYPVVIKQLLRNSLPEGLAMKPYENRLLAPVWDEFRSALRERLETYGTMPDGPRNLCDNFFCDSGKRVKQMQAEPKQCSGCAYVVYCSAECQKQDWTERHRDECKRAHIDHRRRRSNGAWYSHTTRAFHVHFISTMYNRFYDQMQQECAELYPTLPFNHILPVLQCTSARFAVNLEPIVPIPRNNPHYEKKDIKTAWWERGDKTEFKQRWLKPRVSQVIEGYRDGKIGKTDVRVAEAAFPLGDYIVFLTVKLERSSSGRWEPAYSVCRYATKSRGSD